MLDIFNEIEKMKIIYFFQFYVCNKLMFEEEWINTKLSFSEGIFLSTYCTFFDDFNEKKM